MTSSSEQQPKEQRQPNESCQECIFFKKKVCSGAAICPVPRSRPHTEPAVTVCPDLMDADNPLGRRCRVNGWIFCEEIRSGKSHRTCPLEVEAARKAREEMCNNTLEELHDLLKEYGESEDYRLIEAIADLHYRVGLWKERHDTRSTTPQTEQEQPR